METTRTCDVKAAMEMNGINSLQEMENVFELYFLSVCTFLPPKATFPHFLLLSPSSALAGHSCPSNPSFVFFFTSFGIYHFLFDISGTFFSFLFFCPPSISPSLSNTVPLVFCSSLFLPQWRLGYQAVLRGLWSLN